MNDFIENEIFGIMISDILFAVAVASFILVVQLMVKTIIRQIKGI